MEYVKLEGIRMSKAAAEWAKGVGCSPEDDRDQILLSGESAKDDLLAECLDGVDEDDKETNSAIREYVEAVWLSAFPG